MGDTLLTFLAMGGYGRFVWPAYGLVFLVVAALQVTTLRTLRTREKVLMTLRSGQMTSLVGPGK